ncbi:heme-degrading domain-containing protein [Geminicoccus flavidas]|uniref:heme-degrading domain-containing protein n=1 Tax=Geminicoccus flavidas TaxID=2506407 RepID=UPI00135B920F|nr:heme-degrading domain-containing protein [Geminicoccus flavidas]
MAGPEDLAALLAEEERLQFPNFDQATALALGRLMLDRAERDRLPVTIDIRRGEQQLFHAALPGTSADNDAWVERKARAVRRFGHSSWYLGCLARAKGYDFHAKFALDPARFAAHGGSFPIFVKGTGAIGTVTVSGLPQQEDHRFVTAMLHEFLVTMA